jgi:hypothetical protein
MSKMGLHDPFGHLQHKLWPKERSKIKLAIWLPTTESRESTRFPWVQVACDMSLKSSWQGLQLWFRPRSNRRFAPEVIVPQSCETPNLGDFGTPIWESWDKKPFGCHSHGVVQVWYMGEGGGFHRIRVVVNLMSPKLSRLVLAPKVLQKVNKPIGWLVVMQVCVTKVYHSS